MAKMNNKLRLSELVAKDVEFLTEFKKIFSKAFHSLPSVILAQFYGHFTDIIDEYVEKWCEQYASEHPRATKSIFNDRSSLNKAKYFKSIQSFVNTQVKAELHKFYLD